MDCDSHLRPLFNILLRRKEKPALIQFAGEVALFASLCCTKKQKKVASSGF